MESTSYQKLLSDLESREKHILELESELLRVDYEYAVIVKDLKQKYSMIAYDLSSTVNQLKQSRKEHRRAQAMISKKQQEVQQLRNQIQQQTMKLTFNQETIKRLKQENDRIKNEFKYLQANQQKYVLKSQQALKKKDQYKSDNLKLHERIEQLERRVRKQGEKRKQLEQLVQQEVMETQIRIQHIGQQFLSNTRHQIEQIDQPEQGKTLKEQFNKPVYQPSQPAINDWESDMRKLKNCIDYGSAYILVFDLSNLDRMISKEIFKSIKKCLSDKQQLQHNLRCLQEQYNLALREHKQALTILETQLESIVSQRKNTTFTDTQMQTTNPNGPEAQRAVIKLSDLNTKLKYKNSVLIDCIQILALRNVVVEGFNTNLNIKQEYYRKKLLQISKQSQSEDRIRDKIKLRSINKFRIAGLTVLFIKLLTKSIRVHESSMKSQTNSVTSPQSLRGIRIKHEVFKLQQQSIHNPELQKLRDCTIFSLSSKHDKNACTQLGHQTKGQELYQHVDEIVRYYMFKLRNH